MLRDSETSESVAPSIQDSSSDNDENYEVFSSQIYAPYEDEPLADEREDSNEENESDLADEHADIDGLTPSVLEARYENTVSVESWCKCQQCHAETLVGALEFHCCREVVDVPGNMAFDGSIEKINCITEHDDYGAMIIIVQ
ncbi:Hypothetical predicted protein [Paramuricea clavata]|uniref:Uncharacterized protein n=1 Tax=Paramuricea clavata TaxID=317549 RepID=A0A7D9EN39_PARCT|nr:Hypothetical predicted protein [Paramuricea clavata]